MKKIILTHIILLFTTLSIKAQDYHLSHYDAASMYLNPALTGMYGREKGDYRVYLDQRSQWRSLGIKPYMTSYLGYDMPYRKWNKNFGLGAYLINNNGGIGNFNTLTFMVSGSYDIMNSNVNDKNISATANDKHLLTTGIQLGLFYRSTNPDALSYDVQYSFENGGFDKNISSNEAYNRMNITRFDASWGIYYRYIERGRKVHPYGGLSVYHIPMPNESLTGGVSRMPIRWTGHAGCDIKLDDKMKLTPRILYMNQAKAYDLTAGFLFYYRLNENETKIFGGFDYRLKDACIISLGLRHESYALRFSYDINTSYLSNFTNRRGAFEVSLVCIGQKGKPFFKSLTQF